MKIHSSILMMIFLVISLWSCLQSANIDGTAGVNSSSSNNPSTALTIKISGKLTSPPPTGTKVYIKGQQDQAQDVSDDGSFTIPVDLNKSGSYPFGDASADSDYNYELITQNPAKSKGIKISVPLLTYITKARSSRDPVVVDVGTNLALANTGTLYGSFELAKKQEYDPITDPAHKYLDVHIAGTLLDATADVTEQYLDTTDTNTKIRKISSQYSVKLPPGDWNDIFFKKYNYNDSTCDNIMVNSDSFSYPGTDVKMASTYGDAAPWLSNPKIEISKVFSSAVNILWPSAEDEYSNISYDIYVSDANPAYGSFDEVSEVLAGTRVKENFNSYYDYYPYQLIRSEGNSYYINIVAIDYKGQKTAYQPYGEYLTSNLMIYYPIKYNNTINVAPETFYNTLTYYMHGNQFNLVDTDYQTDRFGNAQHCLLLDGTPPDGISTHYRAIISQSVPGYVSMDDPKTITIWYKPLNNDTTGDQALIGFGDNSTAGYFQGIVIKGNQTGADRLCAWTGGSDFAVVNDSSFEISNDWQLLGITYDTGNIVVYRNGIASSPISKTLVNTATQYTLCIGRDSVITTMPVAGYVDDIRFYDRAFSADEMLKLYNITRP